MTVATTAGNRFHMRKAGRRIGYRMTPGAGPGLMALLILLSMWKANKGYFLLDGQRHGRVQPHATSMAILAQSNRRWGW